MLAPMCQICPVILENGSRNAHQILRYLDTCFFHSVFTVKFFFIRYVDYLAGKCYTGMQEESVIRIFDAVCFMCNSAISAKAA